MNKKLKVVIIKVKQLGGVVAIANDEQCFLAMLRFSNDPITLDVMQLYMQFSI
jgi:hypothetical protein